MVSAMAASYPLARQVLKSGIEGAKRKRTLAAIAAYTDEGCSPSLREVAERANLRDWRHAKVLIQRLEADGFVRVEWVQRPSRRWPNVRNRYEVITDAL